MERAREVRALWSWLPAFRAVAEAEHLPTAAAALHVSASSLSRTVRLLEEELGVRLFRREGRRLVLDTAGAVLLARTRDAMRLVHEGILELRGEGMRGRVRVSSSGVATGLVVAPAVADLVAAWPELEVTLATVPLGEVVAALDRGDLDVAVTSEPVDHPDVHVHVLGEVTNGVWCGPGHPLYGRAEVDLDAASAHPFAAPPPDALGRTYEGWPATRSRTVRVRVERMDAGLEVCAGGGLLAVLPDPLAARDGRLWRLAVEGLAPTRVLAVTRVPVVPHDRAGAVVAALRVRMAALDA